MTPDEEDCHIRPIANIRVGKRYRQDMGDIDSLAQSIAEVGLLHPIVIRIDGTLIAGHRRLEACRRLGWKEIDVSVVQWRDDNALIGL